MQVLITDDRAEHVVGANMAFRRTTLRDLGGFDVAYTSAGDDVDICWRLLDAGHEIGFAHAAQVWHHRRNSRDTAARNGWCRVGIGNGSIALARRGGQVFSNRRHGCVGRCSDPCPITATSAWHPFNEFRGGAPRLRCSSARRCCRFSYPSRSSA